MNCTASNPPPVERTFAAYLALDWGDRFHAVAHARDEREASTTEMVGAAPEVFLIWLEALRDRVGATPQVPLAIAVEAGRRGLMTMLGERPWVVLYEVPPLTSAQFRRSLRPSGSKDDAGDARGLLELLRKHREQLRCKPSADGRIRELRALTQGRRVLVDECTQDQQRLYACLKGYFPQAIALLGNNLGTTMALEFLKRWPTLEALRRSRAQTLQDFYTQHRVRRQERIEERLQLRATARSLTEDPSVIEPAVLMMKALVARIECTRGHIQRYEERIAQLLANLPQQSLIESLPGAGATLGPRLLAVLLGEGESPESLGAESMQRRFGVVPRLHQSGRMNLVRWRPGASKFERQTLVEWAAQTVPRSAWAKAFYEQHRARGDRHHTILRKLAARWLRILSACLRNGQSYDESKHLQSLARQGSPYANLPEPTAA